MMNSTVLKRKRIKLEDILSLWSDLSCFSDATLQQTQCVVAVTWVVCSQEE